MFNMLINISQLCYLYYQYAIKNISQLGYIINKQVNISQLRYIINKQVNISQLGYICYIYDQYASKNFTIRLHDQYASKHLSCYSRTFQTYAIPVYKIVFVLLHNIIL